MEVNTLKLKKIVFFFALIFFIGILPGTAAQATVGGLLETAGDAAQYDTGDAEDPYALFNIVGRFIRVFLTMLGVVFSVLVFYGGYTWMTAMGNEQKVEQARATIERAVIGLIIVIAAYALTEFIINILISNYSSGTNTEQIAI